jgi:hypothetical protein
MASSSLGSAKPLIDIVLQKKLREASAGDRPWGEAGKEAEY